MTDDPELAHLRAAIDACNERLCAALDERARLVRAIAAWKHAHGVAALDHGREHDMSRRVRALARADGYGPDALQRIFDAVLAESRAIVTRGLDG
jgi:chorismate mutase